MVREKTANSMKEAAATNNYCYRFVLLVIFVISFFAVRIPLLHEDLGFEEGIFADLIVNRPEGPMYALGGRIDGENLYQYISHPAVPYELLRLGGVVFQKLTKEVYLDDAKITPRLRLICSLYQLLFFGGILLLCLYRHAKLNKWSVLILFTAALSPLAIKTSVHLQIDNTSGVLLCGTAAVLFILSQQAGLSLRRQFLLVFTSGFIAGLGKQEWSFALLACLAVMFLLSWKIKFGMSRQHIIKILSCIIAGLLVSNLSSYFYDPANYMRGLKFIVVFSQSHAISSIDNGLVHWLTLMKLRAPFIFVCFVLLMPISYVLLFREERRFLHVLTSFYGIFLLLGYLVSNWSHVPRYFCPSLAVLTVSAVALIDSSLAQSFRKLLVGGTAFVFVSTVVFIAGFTADKNHELEQINNGSLTSPPGKVLYLSSGAGWNKMNIEYVNNNSPYEQKAPWVMKSYNKELVRPKDVTTGIIQSHQ